MEYSLGPSSSHPTCPMAVTSSLSKREPSEVTSWLKTPRGLLPPNSHPSQTLLPVYKQETGLFTGHSEASVAMLMRISSFPPPGTLTGPRSPQNGLWESLDGGTSCRPLSRGARLTAFLACRPWRLRALPRAPPAQLSRGPALCPSALPVCLSTPVHPSKLSSDATAFAKPPFTTFSHQGGHVSLPLWSSNPPHTLLHHSASLSTSLPRLQAIHFGIFHSTSWSGSDAWEAPWNLVDSTNDTLNAKSPPHPRGGETLSKRWVRHIQSIQ